MFKPPVTLGPISLEAFRAEILSHFHIPHVDEAALTRVETFWDAAFEDLRGAPKIEIEDIDSAHDDDETELGFLRAELPSGEETHFALFRTVPEEELATLLLIAWTGERLALLVPERGNFINPVLREALGRNGEDHEVLLAHIRAHPGLPDFDGAPDDYAEMVEHLYTHAPDLWSAYDISAVCAWIDAAMGTTGAVPI